MPAVENHQGSTSALHALPMPVTGDDARLWIMQPDFCSVAMGSSQSPDHFLANRLETDGIELAPRRSGGGAVFIDPASMLWVDLLIPASHSLWSRDIVAVFERVGAIWQSSLAACGIGTTMYAAGDDGPTSRSPQARLACWAGFGWGELAIDGAKVVGLSQRRTRWGARVQAMAVFDSSPQRVVDYLAVKPGLADDLRSAIGEPPAINVSRDQLVEALVASVVP